MNYMLPKFPCIPADVIKLTGTLVVGFLFLAGGLRGEAEDKEGFTPMFNGKDLTGWQTTGNWVVEDANTFTLIDLDLSQSEMKDRPPRGYISFQDEGKPIWYRNVRIKELK